MRRARSRAGWGDDAGEGKGGDREGGSESTVLVRAVVGAGHPRALEDTHPVLLEPGATAQVGAGRRREGRFRERRNRGERESSVYIACVHMGFWASAVTVSQGSRTFVSRRPMANPAPRYIMKWERNKNEVQHNKEVQHSIQSTREPRPAVSYDCESCTEQFTHFGED